MTIEPWKHKRPSTIEDFFAFYNDYVKLLYSAAQTENTLPNEVLFELNAAFDHISRFWTYNENESVVTLAAFSHLKRACLDILKLKYVETRKLYNKLSYIDTHMIDNGDYTKNLNKTFNQIRHDARDARVIEGKPDVNNLVPAFGLWEDVYIACEKFTTDFYFHPQLNWASRLGFFAWLRKHIWAFIIGVISSFIAAWLFYLISMN